MTTGRTGTDHGRLAAVDSLIKHSSDSKAISLLSKQAEHENWIEEQLVALAEVLRQELTAEGLQLFSRAVSDLPKHQLQMAFRKAAERLKFFPRPAELRELANEYEPCEIKEWKGLTPQQKRERDALIGSTLGKEFMAELHRVAESKGFQSKRARVTEIRQPIRELTDAELEARRDHLKQQAKEVQRRFPAS